VWNRYGRILTAAPTLPEVGCVSTNGPRPTDRLKTVPSLFAPPGGCPVELPIGVPDQRRRDELTVRATTVGTPPPAPSINA
jgi:hypothetical protein